MNDFEIINPNEKKELLERIEKQSELIKQMVEVIGFYAEHHLRAINKIRLSGSIQARHEDCGYSLVMIGKRARELQQSELFKEIVG